MKGNGSTVLCVSLMAAACSSAGDPPAAPHVDATELDAGPVANGQIFVERRGCPGCHSSKNPSDGVLSGSTEPIFGTETYPPNLTPDPETGLGTWSDDDIARAIRTGFGPGLEQLCRQMSRFDRMSDPETLSIIAYLRSLPPIRRAIPPSVCPPIKPRP